MPINAADRKSIRAQEKAARLAASRREEVVRSIMSTTDGREWMWNLISECHVFATTFNPDTHRSAFQEGERNVGLRIISDIMTACPEEYINAQREANVRYTLDERRRSQEPDRGDSGSATDANPSDADPSIWGPDADEIVGPDTRTN